MKKLVSFLLAIAICISFYIFPVSAAQNINVLLNGTFIAFDQPPIIEDGRTLVSIRAVFEALGADVYWNEENQIVGIIKNKIKIFAMVDETEILKFEGNDINEFQAAIAELDNKIIDINENGVPTRLIGGRVFVPLRAISEGLGVTVDWLENNHTAVLTCDENFISQKNTDKTYFDDFIHWFEDMTELENENFYERNKERYKDYPYVATIKITGFSDFETYVKDREYIEAKMNSTGMGGYTFDLSQKNEIAIIFGYNKGFDIDKFVENLTSEVRFDIMDATNNIVLDRFDVTSANAVWNGSRQAFDIILKLNAEGQKKLSAATERISQNEDNHVYVYFGDQLISSPRVESKVDSDTLVISGGFTGGMPHAIASLITTEHQPQNLNIDLTIDQNNTVQVVPEYLTGWSYEFDILNKQLISTYQETDKEDSIKTTPIEINDEGRIFLPDAFNNGLYDKTTDEIWNKMEMQVFGYTSGGFIYKNGEQINLPGNYMFGMLGDVCVSDLDNDGIYELIYLSHWGSGVNGTSINCYSENRTISCDLKNTFGLEFLKKDDQNILVKWDDGSTDELFLLKVKERYVLDTIRIFSYQSDLKFILGKGTGVKTDGFVNTTAQTIEGAKQILDLARKEIAIDYDAVAVYYDAAEAMWKVSFWTDRMVGGDASVYLSNDGITEWILFGE